MIFKKIFRKSDRIEFRVDGKPPKKTKPSLWSEKSPQTQLVLDLRKKAYEESKKAGLDGHFSGPVKTDIQDAWEREGEERAFFERFSPDGYALGINVVLHAMMH